MTGRSVGFDASPLSCFLFRPRKSCEKRKKRSHTNVSDASVIRASTPPAQTVHVCFHSRKRVHTRLSEKNRTQGHTRRNRGVSDGGAISTLGAFCVIRKPCVVRYQNGKLCRFWVLAGGAPEERREPAGQRCAYACRCSEGVAAPLGCVIFFAFVEIAACTPCTHGLSACARRGVVSLPSVHFACSRNAGRPLVKTAHLPFSEVRWA